MSTQFDLVDDSATFFAPASTDMVDSLLAQYRAMRGKIERLAAAMAGPDFEGAMGYFAEYAHGQDYHLSTDKLASMFNLDGALAYLNAAFWSKALHLTDVLDLMPQKRRSEWSEQIRNPMGTKRDKYAKDWLIPPIPEFNSENVRGTLVALLSQRQTFFAERVDGIFQSLSKVHVTNCPEGFSRRMILSDVTDSFAGANHGKSGVINDLRCIIAKFMGRDEPKWDATGPIIRYARERRGEWVTLDGGAMRIRCYMVGTAHLEVHPDMAWRLNAILAQLHPLAIPSQFRERPKKKLKEFVLMSRPLPFAVVARLGMLKHAQDLNPNKGFRENTWIQVKGCYDLPYVGDTGDKTVDAEVCRILESLGGSPVGKNGKNLAGEDRTRWAFDYPVLEVIKEIMASGCLPDVKAHQFYPTPAGLARALVEIAYIGPDHTVLEPSAGQGGLADLLPKDRTTCVEVAALNVKVLEEKGHRVVQADFMAWAGATDMRFDRVAMNPPFSEGRAEAHTRAAAGLLKPGGRLVAILPSGMRGKDIPGLACTWSMPMANQFPGVSVEIVLMTADRPA